MGPPWRVFLLVIVYFVYLFFGATIFSAIEHPIEGRMVEELRNQKDSFLQAHKCVDGKVFCMIYALIGIPFTLFLLSILVEKMLRPVELLLDLMNSRLGHLHSPGQIRALHFCLVSSLLLLLFLLLPALLLDMVEPVWSWFDSFYYCFISLTTVGLGDFIPGDSPDQAGRSVYKTLVTVYLVLGLVAVMTIVTIVTNTPELDFTGWFRSDYKAEGDPERQRLQIPGVGGPQLYGEQNNTDPASKKPERRVVRARSRRDEEEEYEESN